MNRITKSNNLFIDGTFHHPVEFTQLLIIMYKDIITDLKIPGIYILLNSKNEDLYNMVFEDVIKLISWQGLKKINIKTIVTDSERALMNSVNKNFPKAQRVACYFHYKEDIIRNLRTYGLYKNEMKNTTNEVIKILSSIPFIYKGKIEIVKKIIEETKSKYPNYSNFIDNYFINNKMQYFKDNSLNYSIIPDDCRTNNFLENYNGYLKMVLGKHRIINWVNFIHFIKAESQRSIEKLMNNCDNNMKTYKRLNEKENIDIKNEKKLKKEVIKHSDEEKVITDRNYKKNLFIESNLNIENEIIFKKLPDNENQIGIINIGNSCYINSIIQILLHTPIFIDEFIIHKEQIKKMPMSTSYNFLQIYDNIKKANDYKNKEIDISFFIYFFSLKHPQFKLYEQQDSIEFFRVFSEDINTELNKSKKFTAYQEIIYSNDNNKIIMSKEFDKKFREKENSIISENFYSQLLTSYICECQSIKYAFQKISDIPLLLPENKKEASLNEILNNFFSAEKVDFEYKCKNCNKVVKHLKYIKFSILTIILTISLQRIDVLNNKKMI